MQLMLDRDQTEIIREILESALTELRVESSRTDTHDYREKLHRREHAVEAVLEQLEQVEGTSDLGPQTSDLGL